jgi:hypothetical protein
LYKRENLFLILFGPNRSKGMGPFLSIFCSSSTHTTVDSPTPVRTTETKCEDNFDDWFEIGEGGYGRVFRALDKRTGETVAIKKIDLAKVDDYVEEEVLNLAKCLHPQIIQFKEVRTSSYYHLCNLHKDSAWECAVRYSVGFKRQELI